LLHSQSCGKRHELQQMRADALLKASRTARAFGWFFLLLAVLILHHQGKKCKLLLFFFGIQAPLQNSKQFSITRKKQKKKRRPIQTTISTIPTRRSDRRVRRFENEEFPSRDCSRRTAACHSSRAIRTRNSRAPTRRGQRHAAEREQARRHGGCESRRPTRAPSMSKIFLFDLRTFFTSSHHRVRNLCCSPHHHHQNRSSTTKKFHPLRYHRHHCCLASAVRHARQHARKATCAAVRAAGRWRAE